jgi:hypothetical protein
MTHAERFTTPRARPSLTEALPQAASASAFGGGLTVPNRVRSLDDSTRRGRAGADGIDGQDGAPGAPGADGIDGQDGAPGAPGADGIDGQDGAPGEQGPPGPEGPAGPKGGDSIRTNAHGTKAVGIVEGTQGQWLDLVPHGEPIEPWLEDELVEPVRFVSECGRFDLIVGVPKHCEHWRMPTKTPQQAEAAKAQWREISQNTLLARIESLEDAIAQLKGVA